MNNNIAQDVAGLKEQLIETRRDFHRNPELSFQEKRTAEIAASKLETLGWKVKRGVAETGVVGLLEGSGPGPTVMIRVDIDALPIQEPKDRPYSSLVDGVMHACGHDGHTAVGMAVAELLSRYRDSIKGNVKLVFQPAEEIMSGAIRMIEEGVMKDPDVDRVLSFHLWSGLPVGQIVSQPGPIFSSADEIKITVKGKGGHGGMPHLSVDPILTACHVVTALQTVLSREIAPTQTAVLGFGTIHGGTAFNVVSDQVELSGTVRTLDDSVRAFILKRDRRDSFISGQRTPGRGQVRPCAWSACGAERWLSGRPGGRGGSPGGWQGQRGEHNPSPGGRRCHVLPEGSPRLLLPGGMRQCRARHNGVPPQRSVRYR